MQNKENMNKKKLLNFCESEKNAKGLDLWKNIKY